MATRKVKAEVILNAFRGRALSNLASRDLPVDVSLKLAEVFEEVESRGRLLQKEVDKLVEKYCDKDAENKPLKEKVGNLTVTKIEIQRDDYDKDYEKLAEQEVDFKISKPTIKLSDFEDNSDPKNKKKATLSTVEIQNLSK